jgi:hypothetical protein
MCSRSGILIPYDILYIALPFLCSYAEGSRHFNIQCFRYTVKKVIDFRGCRDFAGMSSRLGTGKSKTFFYSVQVSRCSMLFEKCSSDPSSSVSR